MIKNAFAPPRRAPAVDELKTLAANRIPDILRDLCGVPAEAIQAAELGNRREFPCPKCGGGTRFRVTDLNVGRVYCSHCCANAKTGSSDFLGAVKWWNEIAFPEALRTVADYLGLESAAPFVSANRNAASSSFAPATNGERTRTGGAVAVPSDGSTKIAAYDYPDESGAVRWRVRRIDVFDAKGERVERRFLQGRVVDGRFEKGLNGEKLPPYNLPRLLDPACRVVYVVEGEKCADALNEFFDELVNKRNGGKSVATTLGSSKNAKRWPEYAERLCDKEIVVFADLDEPGEEAAQAAAKAFANVGASVDVVSFTRGENADGEPVDFERPNGEGAPPPTYDVADYLDDLRAATATLEPEKARAIRWSKFLNLLKTFSREVDADPAPRTPELPADRREGSPESARKPLPETASSLPRQEENGSFVEDLEAAERRVERERRAREKKLEREIVEESAPFPVDALSPVLARFVDATADDLGQEAGPSALAALTVASCVAGFRYRLDVPEYGYIGIRPKMNAMLVGVPGSGKTPVSERALRPLVRLEQDAILAFNASDDAGLPPAYVVRDATPQAFQRLLIWNRRAARQYGTLFYMQEASQTFDFDSRSKGAGTAYSILIDVDGGGPQCVARVYQGKENLTADAVCCAYLGEIQPDPLRRAIEKDASFIDQGFVYRWPWVYVPKRPVKTRARGASSAERDAEKAEARRRYEQLIAWLDYVYPTLEPDETSTGTGSLRFKRPVAEEPGRTLRLAPDALDVYDRFIEEVNAEDARLEGEGMFFNATYRTKSLYFVLRLALLLHVCDRFDVAAFERGSFYPPGGDVSAGTVERAARVVRWIWDAFDQCFRLVRDESAPALSQASPLAALERRTLEVLRAFGAEGATAGEISRKVPTFGKDRKGREKRDKVLKRLCADGLARRTYNRAEGAKKSAWRYATVDSEIETEETDEAEE